MSLPALKTEDLPHYTYDDYVQWEGRWELIRGVPFAMAPQPRIKHQRICGNIYWLLRELLGNCPKCEVLWPVDWPVTEDTVVQPDMLIICSDSENIGVEKLEVTPVVVFEVLSPSSSRKDRVIKYRLYEAAGVKYYCIVDPETDSADVFVLQKDKYRGAEEFKEERLPFNLGPCEIEFDFGRVFRPPS
ncbi:MAG: Uma2 family endonuclease [Candidatus Aminicenantes bacterium]|nr:Uma2 family endonuclease [Candidatus Aminicenantes bacterium]